MASKRRSCCGMLFSVCRHFLLMSVLLFAMLDGSTLPVLRSFVDQHLANGVVPRLLGFPMPDGLSTPNPSMDEKKRLTILCELGMEKQDFLDLLQLLRTRDVTEMALSRARRAALLLGGVEVVDAYVLPAPPAPQEPAVPYHPILPEQDTLHHFQWTVALDNEIAARQLIEHGWSVTGPARDAFRYYLRKPRSS